MEDFTNLIWNLIYLKFVSRNRKIVKLFLVEIKVFHYRGRNKRNNNNTLLNIDF